MKGFLIKDIYLLVQRKQTILVLAAVCLIMALTAETGFIVGYMAFLSVILAVSTISYDDADNGMIFLMTLPAKRSTYAVSKYLLGVLMSGAACLLTAMLLLLVNAFRGGEQSAAELVLETLMSLPLSLVIMDVMIPMQLKFGAEKSRIVTIVIFGGLAAVGMLLSRTFGAVPAVQDAFEALSRVTPLQLTIAVLALCAAGTLVSLKASCVIMEKKAF